ncbi:major facilitator superfamily domain-containing protein [Suillus ampliporus]|nr:major facilitator superfamily domain-containing protein [Suillus ampliporus]
MADSPRMSVCTFIQPEESKKEDIFNSVPDTVSIQSDQYLVRFDEGDPANPKVLSTCHQRRDYHFDELVNSFRTGPLPKSGILTFTAGLLVLNATFASSAPSALVPIFIEIFGISQEVGTLTISLFVCGYCVGPLLWGPLSEQYGRRPIFIISFFVYMCFQVGCALAQNARTLLVLRFIAGTFAAAPLANSGALISDIWNAKERGTALAIFTVAPFAGPAMGPLVSGFLVVGDSGVCWLQIVFTIPETYAPVLLVKKAKEIRQNTGDEKYHAAMELQNFTLAQRVETIFGRPFKLLFTEPMMFVITLYMSFVYGCVYLLFEAYPIVFEEGHGLNPGVSGLMFLPLTCGGFTAVATYIIIFNPQYERKVQEYAPNPVPPEFRLRIAMIAAPFFAGSFFWFAWTSYPSISIWAPMMSGALLGWSICLIFLTVSSKLALFNYIIDAYLASAASALAASTVARSLFGAGFPLFATQMYDKLGPEWASSLLGFIALILAPIPFVLTKYGPLLRAKSKYAPSAPPPSSSPV